ncbi:MAG TPA: hypothetical protein IAB56_04420 [Candidatus Scybalousia intestinigallinarum]|nr:hypothetical protein [Candidatus Scybalousia intestinigallinarum]
MKKRWVKKLRKIRGTLTSTLVIIFIILIVVLVGLAIFTGYRLSRERNEDFSNYEEQFLEKVVLLVDNCLYGDEKNALCSKYVLPRNTGRYEFFYLQDLVDGGLLESFTNPYDKSEKCDLESYVYVDSRSDTTNSSYGYDLDYHVCLMCGDKKSKECLDNYQEEEKYDLACEIAYDQEGTQPYQGEWTDQPLYLIVKASGDVSSKVSQFYYYIGDEAAYSDGTMTTDLEGVALLNRNVASQYITVESYDEKDNKATASCGNYPVRIDKDTLNYVIITGVLSNANRDLVANGDYSPMEVILEANTDPLDSISGFTYTWYRNNEVFKETTTPTITVDQDGAYSVEVTNAVGKQKVTSEQFIVYIDKEKPKVKVLEDTLTLDFGQDYDFRDNLEVTFGSSGGTYSCDPSNNNYLGTEDQKITCIATGKNGLETKVTFQVKREQ